MDRKGVSDAGTVQITEHEFEGLKDGEPVLKEDEQGRTVCLYHITEHPDDLYSKADYGANTRWEIYELGDAPDWKQYSLTVQIGEPKEERGTDEVREAFLTLLNSDDVTDKGWVHELAENEGYDVTKHVEYEVE